MKPSTASFYQKVYEIVRQIPAGKVCTYGDIAKYIGTGLSARMVGYAMNHSHTEMDFVPAHRVVNRNGLLTGKFHFETDTLMQQFLENEGVVVVNNQVQNFGNVRWFPFDIYNQDNDL